MVDWVIEAIAIKCPICRTTHNRPGEHLASLELLKEFGCKVVCPTCGYIGELP